MKSIKAVAYTLWFLLCFFTLIFADEGMWMLDQLKNLDWKELQKRGLQLSLREVQDLKDAVVIIDGGTGEFVSRKGLLLTNHHVAYGAIQRSSSVEQNLIESGFLAKTVAEEIPIPGYEVKITKYFKDVTKRVLSAVTDQMGPLERYQAIARRKAEIEAQAEKEEGLEAHVVEFYNGMKYYLFVYENFKDVRLVYAPPRSIGEYGGDIDNWMWPRHTGDFAFFRVYASKEGKPAEYSKENIPFTPKKYLKISSAGVKEGDFTFILGYPGTTYRYRTSHSIDYYQNINYPFQIELFKIALDILEKEAGKDPEVAIKVSGFIKGINNVLKNNQGMLEGFKHLNLLEKKKQFEKDFLTFLNTRPDLKNQYGTVLDDIGKLYVELRGRAPKANWLRFFRFIRLPSSIYMAYRYALEKEKPEAERDPQYSEKNIEREIKYLRYRSQQYVPSVDKEFLKAALKKLAHLPEGPKIKVINHIVGEKTGLEIEKAIDDYTEQIFAGTRYQNITDVIPLFEKTAPEIEAMQDPLIQFVLQMDPEFRESERKSKEFNGAITQLRSRYMQALFAWKGENLYPDANRTLRFTYGEVRSYRPRDAVLYLPKTCLSGVVEKHTGKEPFIVPQKLLQLAAHKEYGNYVDRELNDVAVNFLHTTDITGGNSGSPVLNGKGELIGVAFDGNYEAMTSDYQFDNDITRSISVDSRYILFILDKFSEAKNVLSELTIVGYPMTRLHR